jgi:integrase
MRVGSAVHSVPWEAASKEMGGMEVRQFLVSGSGWDIRTVQQLLGHSHVNTTRYTHVLNRISRSP